MTLILALFLAFGDVTSVKAEPNPEKRSEVALDNANRAIDEARSAYNAGDVAKTDAELTEMRESVDISLESLEQSGKKPRTSKYYKSAEMKLRHLLRRLAGFRDEMNVEDRKPIEDATARVQDVHDRVLAAIMSKKR